MASVLPASRRLVIKVGSSLVTNEGRGIDAEAIGNWARQAAAAVGQMGLAQIYETSLARHGLHSAQVLLTHADLADRERYLNARSTLLTLLSLKVIPVINENDTVVNDEIKFGDNDTLGALVANLVDADAYVILTDQRGLYTADPRKDPGARLVDEAQAGDPNLEAMAGGAGSGIGRGGMLTKVLAAKRAARSGTSRKATASTPMVGRLPAPAAITAPAATSACDASTAPSIGPLRPRSPATPARRRRSSRKGRASCRSASPMCRATSCAAT